MTGALTPDFNKSPAQLAANILLDIEAIHISPDDPFTFTSGRLSPVYVDCRRIISFPRARSELMKMGVSLLNHEAGVEVFDAVAGGETASPANVATTEEWNVPESISNLTITD